jgi:hypothetical protein
MRSCFIAPLLLAAFAAVPATAQVEGRWQMASINGNALPTAMPSEDGPLITRGSFAFGPDGRFSISISADTKNKGRATQGMAGTYTTRGDTLTLTGEVGWSSVNDLRWVRRGDTLQLYAEDEEVYHLVREPEAARGESWTPGTWHAAQLNGRELPAPWLDDPDITITHMVVTLTAAGRLNLRMRGVVQGETIEEESSAPYSVTGDKLAFLDEGDGTVEDEFVWTLGDGTLRLVDENGHVYTFVRP